MNIEFMLIFFLILFLLFQPLDVEVTMIVQTNKVAWKGNVSTLVKPKFVEGVKDARSNNIWQSVYQVSDFFFYLCFRGFFSQIHLNKDLWGTLNHCRLKGYLQSFLVSKLEIWKISDISVCVGCHTQGSKFKTNQ